MQILESIGMALSMAFSMLWEILVVLAADCLICSMSWHRTSVTTYELWHGVQQSHI